MIDDLFNHTQLLIFKFYFALLSLSLTLAAVH